MKEEIPGIKADRQGVRIITDKQWRRNNDGCSEGRNEYKSKN